MDNRLDQTAFPLLEARNVGKLYTRSVQDTRKRLGRMARQSLFGKASSKPQKRSGSGFWAVDSVSFDLHRGSAVGIIGLNGSGKTTMLRMLAGQLLPDAGEIILHGTSAAMIDLQAGFQQSASGRENIFLRSAALGFGRTETRERLDEVIAFSELDEAIDAPLATYSSGMRMRLAFAVMVMVSPDVLLIDEVLAVGDFRFRQKCLAKVREMRERSAFVFVSHSMGDVEKFCDHVIVLHKGRVHFQGAAKEAIEAYEELDHGSVIDVHEGVEAAMGPTIQNSDAITNVTHKWCDANGAPIETVGFNDPFELRVSFRPMFDIRKLIVGVPVWALNAHYTTGLSTQINSDPLDVKAGENVSLRLAVEGGYFNPGNIKSMISILDGPEFLFREMNPNLLVESAPHPTWGAVTVPHRWTRLDRPGSYSEPIRLVKDEL